MRKQAAVHSSPQKLQVALAGCFLAPCNSRAASPLFPALLDGHQAPCEVPTLPHSSPQSGGCADTPPQESFTKAWCTSMSQAANSTDTTGPKRTDNQTESEERRYEELSEMDPGEAADILLAESIEALGRGEYPFYSPPWMRQLAARESLLPAADEPHDVEPEYLPQACLRLLAQTEMPREMRSAIRLSINGFTNNEMAEHLKMDSREEADDLIRAGLARLAAAALDLDEMLNEREAIRAAWREDTHRYGAHCERHCKPGQEACRTTPGHVCPYRWYLMYED